MRLLLCILWCSLLPLASIAQSSEHKIGISIGGGPLDYKSSLGNGFKFSSPGWHGAGDLYIGYYVNPSFDIVFFGSVGDLGSARQKSLGMAFKYKAADDYLMPESSFLKPYVYLAAAFNSLADRVKLRNTANYMSLNGGLGVRCYVWSPLSLGYNLSLGYFIADNTFSKLFGNANEMYIHNAILLGVDLF